MLWLALLLSVAQASGGATEADAPAQPTPSPESAPIVAPAPVVEASPAPVSAPADRRASGWLGVGFGGGALLTGAVPVYLKVPSLEYEWRSPSERLAVDVHGTVGTIVVFSWASVGSTVRYRAPVGPRTVFSFGAGPLVVANLALYLPTAMAGLELRAGFDLEGAERRQSTGVWLASVPGLGIGTGGPASTVSFEVTHKWRLSPPR
jgi:hypothetical protein